MTIVTLLIEDNIVNAIYIKSILNSIANNPIYNINYKIVECVTLQDALKTLAQEKFDIILLDLTLPDSAGIDTFSKVNEHNEHLPIIILSSIDDLELAMSAVKNGAQDYLLKGSLDKNLLYRSIHYAIQRMQIREKLKESEERFQIATSATNEGIWEWNLKQNKLYSSNRWKEILGYEKDIVTDDINEWFDRIHPDDLKKVEKEIINHLEHRSLKLISEHRLRSKSDGYKWVRIYGMAVYNEEGGVRKIAGSLSDITNEKLQDSLTGLPNLTLFLDRINSSIQRLSYEKDYSFILIVLQIESLKMISVNYSALVADKIIILVSDKLKNLLPKGTTIGRIEYDEFGLLLHNLGDIGKTNEIIKNIQTTISSPMNIDGHEFSISSSAGIVFSDLSSKNSEEMLKNAGAAMQNALKKGRSSSDVFNEELRAYNKKVFKMEADLRRAIERCEFELHYQPIINTETNKVETLEALIRWYTIKGESVGPAEFIPVAEQTDMIMRVGTWVIEEASLQLQSWKQLGINNLSIALNFSARMFQSRQMVDYLQKTLSLANLPFKNIEIEITEGLVMDDMEYTRAVLNELHALGVSISIDDFGTGYSSLSYLKKIAINKVKIDKSFIDDIIQDAENYAIVDAITRLSHALKYKVVAEGVESKEQYDILKNLKVDYIQGYYISRPKNSIEIIDLLKEKNYLLL